MTSDEIREQINENNRLIEQAMRPNQFILNDVVYGLLQENADLRNQCSHQFVDGYCIFCDQTEVKV